MLEAGADDWALVPLGSGLARRTLGPETGQSLRAWLDDPGHRRLLSRLAEAGVAMDALPVPEAANRASAGADFTRPCGDGPGGLSGKTVVITGTLPGIGRAEAKRILEEACALVAGSVGRGTDYVVAGEAAGQKLGQARRLGVKVLDWPQALRMMGKEP